MESSSLVGCSLIGLVCPLSQEDGLMGRVAINAFVESLYLLLFSSCVQFCCHVHCSEERLATAMHLCTVISHTRAHMWTCPTVPGDVRQLMLSGFPPKIEKEQLYKELGKYCPGVIARLDIVENRGYGFVVYAESKQQKNVHKKFLEKCEEYLGPFMIGDQEIGVSQV